MLNKIESKLSKKKWEVKAELKEVESWKQVSFSKDAKPEPIEERKWEDKKGEKNKHKGSFTQ